MSKQGENDLHLHIVTSIPGRHERRLVRVLRAESGYADVKRRVCEAWDVPNPDGCALLYRHSTTGQIVLLTSLDEWTDAVHNKFFSVQQGKLLHLELCEYKVPTSAELRFPSIVPSTSRQQDSNNGDLTAAPGPPFVELAKLKAAHDAQSAELSQLKVLHSQLSTSHASLNTSHASLAASHAQQEVTNKVQAQALELAQLKLAQVAHIELAKLKGSSDVTSAATLEALRTRQEELRRSYEAQGTELERLKVAHAAQTKELSEKALASDAQSQKLADAQTAAAEAVATLVGLSSEHEKLKSAHEAQAASIVNLENANQSQTVELNALKQKLADPTAALTAETELLEQARAQVKELEVQLAEANTTRRAQAAEIEELGARVREAIANSLQKVGQRAEYFQDQLRYMGHTLAGVREELEQTQAHLIEARAQGRASTAVEPEPKRARAGGSHGKERAQPRPVIELD